MQYERERKGFWRRWGWTLVFALIIVGVSITGAVLSTQPLGRAPSTPPPSAIAGAAETQFTPVGIEYATAARAVTVNLTDWPIPASRLGLGDDDTAAIPGTEIGTSLTFIGGPEHVDIYPIGSISVSAARGTVDEIRVDYPAGGVREARDAVLALSADLGVPADAIADAVADIRRDQRAGRASGTSLEGELFGAPAVVSIDCDASGTCLTALELHR